MITKIDGMTIAHNGFKILYVKCQITGKFIKHAQAMTALYKDFISNLLAVSACTMSLILLIINMMIVTN